MISLFATPLCWASPARLNEIHVTLFGQPCVLHGPLDSNTLRAIHSISPEEIYPVYTGEGSAAASAEQIRKSIDRVRSHSTQYPPLLDLYRERLGKRLEQMAGFFEALENSRWDKGVSLIALAEKSMRGKDAQSFAQLAHKLEHKGKAQPGANEQEIRGQLFDLFSDGIGADPQEEFHRAIRKLNVTYTCSFEEGDGEGGDE